MDPLGAVLDTHRARRAFVLRAAMTPPWGLRVADRAAVALIVVERGELSLVPHRRKQIRLGRGDVVVIKSAPPYLLADDPRTPPDVAIEPGQVCRPLRGDGWPLQGRTWGNDPDGPCAFVVGVYELPGQIAGRVLEELPDVMVVRAGAANAATVGLLVAEVASDAPGQELVLDRLVDLVLLDTLRAWLAEAGDRAPGWWRARHDRVTAHALAAIHDRPEQPWTLATLADAAGVSRATLARRFQTELGQPPLAYLTAWRMDRAADLLATSTDSVERVAVQVGYANAFAFSTAFKRAHGHAPRDHRARALGRR